MKKLFLCLLSLTAASAALCADTAPIDKWESGNFSFLPQSFQKDPHLNVMIVTEFTAAGRKAPQASPDKPVYYLIHDGGETEVGATVAGEKPPSDKDLAEVLHRTLASGGYHEASQAHPASILVFYRWGSFNHLQTFDDSGGPDGASAAPTDDLEGANLIERAALVGGTKFAVEMGRFYQNNALTQFEHMSPRNEFLMQQVYSDRYFVIATAYDVAAAAQNKQVPLWRTKISTDSRGIMMNESLPGLIAVAGPYFGHETSGPVRLNRAVIAEGKVSIGTPIVKGVLPPDTPNTPPAPPPAK